MKQNTLMGEGFTAATDRFVQTHIVPRMLPAWGPVKAVSC
jgi:hypothetical protein